MSLFKYVKLYVQKKQQNHSVAIKRNKKIDPETEISWNLHHQVEGTQVNLGKIDFLQDQSFESTK